AQKAHRQSRRHGFITQVVRCRDLRHGRQRDRRRRRLSRRRQAQIQQLLSSVASEGDAVARIFRQQTFQPGQCPSGDRHVGLERRERRGVVLHRELLHRVA
ncbi:MAG: hypothetical protein ACK559_01680, partial [bacterium]